MSKRKTWNESILFVLSAPSGAGKSTLAQRLLRKDKTLTRTISHTTRSKRPGERNGKDYFFVDHPTFVRMVEQRKFVEWVEIYGHKYGTSKSTIEDSLSTGRDVLLIIEARGGMAVQKVFRNTVMILVLPPDLGELKKRLCRRRGASSTEIEKRLAQARREMRVMLAKYDYVIINRDLGLALQELQSIVCAERLKKAMYQKKRNFL